MTVLVLLVEGRAQWLAEAAIAVRWLRNVQIYILEYVLRGQHCSEGARCRRRDIRLLHGLLSFGLDVVGWVECCCLLLQRRFGFVSGGDGMWKDEREGREVGI